MILIKKTTVSSCIKTQGKNLEHRENTGKTQGISSSPERGHPEDGRSKHTWSFSQSHQLTSPTVFDPTYEDFAVVVNNTTLHRWQETTNDISKYAQRLF